VGIWHHQDRWVDVLCLQGQYPEKDTVSSPCLTAAKNAQLTPNWTITIRGTFCYSGAEGRGRTAVFKNANLTKDKEKLRKCSRSKEAKQTWQVSAHPGPRQEPVLEGGCQKLSAHPGPRQEPVLGGDVKRNRIRLTDKNWNLDGKLDCYIRINVLSFEIHCGYVRENPHS